MLFEIWKKHKIRILEHWLEQAQLPAHNTNISLSAASWNLASPSMKSFSNVSRL